jgi:predicted PurR-regulated permease PerM
MPAKQQEPGARRVLRIDITMSTMLKASCTVGLLWLLLQLWPILLVVGSALMLVGMLALPIAWLEHNGVRRGLAIALVFVGLFVAGAVFAALTVPSLIAQATSIVDRLPQTQALIARELQKNELTAPLAHSVQGQGSNEISQRVAQAVLEYSPRVAEILAYGATCLFLALYLIIDRERMRGALFALVPRTFHVRLSRILLNLETIVGGYTRGQILTSVLMGVFTFVVLILARVPNAVVLAVFAAATDVLPYIGGLLACGPAVLAAWPRGVPVMSTVLVVLVAYQEFESRILVPRVYGRTLRLPAATVMVALLVGGKLLGILGALLALPFAAAIRMVIEELRYELPGEDLHDTAMRQRDAREERVFERLAAGAPAEQAATIATEIAEARIKHDKAEAQAEDPAAVK